MRTLKVHIVQPGLDNNPLAVIGVFPYRPNNLAKLHTQLLEDTQKPTEAFNNYIKDELKECIDSCTPLAIKKENGLVTIILQEHDIDNKNTR